MSHLLHSNSSDSDINEHALSCILNDFRSHVLMTPANQIFGDGGYVPPAQVRSQWIEIRFANSTTKATKLPLYRKFSCLNNAGNYPSSNVHDTYGLELIKAL
jgi:hypothetical protein